MSENDVSFPTSIDGSIQVPSSNDNSSENIEQVAARLEVLLRQASATHITRHGRVLTFRGGLFRFVLNWNILVPVGSGSFEIEDRGTGIWLHYRGSTVQMLVVVTVTVAFMALSIAHSSAQNGTDVAVAVAIFMWCFLFGANYLLASGRFPRWLKRGLEYKASVGTRKMSN